MTGKMKMNADQFHKHDFKLPLWFKLPAWKFFLINDILPDDPKLEAAYAEFVAVVEQVKLERPNDESEF